MQTNFEQARLDASASWKEAFLAGTAALFLPLVYMLPSLAYLVIPGSWKAGFNWLSIIFIYVVLLAGLTWVWKRGWPRWSGGWVARLNKLERGSL